MKQFMFRDLYEFQASPLDVQEHSNTVLFKHMSTYISALLFQ